MKLSVWAPNAEEVSAQLGERRVGMQRDDGGWWRTQEDFPPGSDYGFVVDGGKPMPDPRSAWQPYGVHGPSRVVDHASYRWRDNTWQAAPLDGAVIYELHVGTFTPEGTFAALREKLPYFAQLGVTHLELMPLAEFSGARGWGYDGVDLFAPYHHYGTPDDLKELLDACHERGLAVLIDVVYNHLGPSGNYLGQFGPYLTERHKTPWGQAVNLDDEYSDDVRRFFCDNAGMWLRDYHFDGLRLDAVHAYVDLSAVHFLEQIKSEVAELGRVLGRHLVVIAESDRNDPRLLLPQAAGGYGIDAQWSDDFHHALHTVLTGENRGYYADFGSLEVLARALRSGYVVAGDYSPFRKRHHGRPLPPGMTGSRLLGYMQNHDQIGNRAKGERIGALVSAGRLKIGAALLLTSPFVPMLFQGEEWSAGTPFCYFSGHEEEWLADAVRRGRRAEFAAFGWRPEQIPDPQSEETFTSSKLDWTELERGANREIWAWYRDLIALRRRSPALLDGRLDRVAVAVDERAQTLVLRRGEAAVACNFSSEQRELALEGAYETALSSDASRSRFDGKVLQLAPESVMILVPQGSAAPAARARSY